MDPIEGGVTNAYDYPADPINGYDLSGMKTGGGGGDCGLASAGVVRSDARKVKQWIYVGTGHGSGQSGFDLRDWNGKVRIDFVSTSSKLGLVHVAQYNVGVESVESRATIPGKKQSIFFDPKGMAFAPKGSITQSYVTNWFPSAIYEAEGADRAAFETFYYDVYIWASITDLESLQ